MNARRRHKKIRLNLVLWLTFSAFALFLILLFLAAQSFIIGRRYRRQAAETLRTAGSEMTEIFSEPVERYTAWREIVEIAEKYDVSYALFYTDGKSVFPSVIEEDYSAVAEQLKLQIKGGAVLYGTGDEIAYAAVVSVEGENCFLYLTDSLTRLNDVESGIVWGSLITVAFALLLAFLASGLVAMLITKPVDEVTSRAKQLAMGHFDFDLKRNYFCAEISELAEALDYARQEISKTDAMQKELIANVSHDFKTPLTMIKAYASMIQEISGDDPVKRKAHTDIIIGETDRLTALVDDLLDLSRLRAGVGQETAVTFNLSETVYRIVSRFDYLTETQGYRFETDILDDLYGYADRARIEQVIYNLIGNAVNYTGEDKTVYISLCPKGEYVRFEVRDTGKGIAPEEIDTIWERYYRSSEMHKRPVQGTGLGLSIVKTILIAQHCPYGVSSKQGEGSTFWAEIPLPPEDVAREKEEGA